jgi:hypothetical protein
MAKSTTRARRTGQAPLPITLEERLFTAYEQLVLLAELQVVAPDYLEPGALTPPACRAVATLCRHGAADLRALLDTLPPALKNWSAGETPSRRGPTKGS